MARSLTDTDTSGSTTDSRSAIKLSLLQTDIKGLKDYLGKSNHAQAKRQDKLDADRGLKTTGTDNRQGQIET